MAPCVETPPRRRFAIGFKDGAEKVVCADKLTRPNGPKPWYTLTGVYWLCRVLAGLF